jgi:hypothetical protein
VTSEKQNFVDKNSGDGNRPVADLVVKIWSMKSMAIWDCMTISRMQVANANSNKSFGFSLSFSMEV